MKAHHGTGAEGREHRGRIAPARRPTQRGLPAAVAVKRPLAWACATLVAGVLLGRWLAPGEAGTIWAGVVGFAAVALGRAMPLRRSLWPALVVAGAAGFAAGAPADPGPWPYAPRAGVVREIYLEVLDTPRPAGNAVWETRATITLGAAAGLPAGSGLLVRTPGTPGWGPGDALLLRGSVRPLRERLNPGAPPSRTPALLREGVTGTVFVPHPSRTVRIPAALRRPRAPGHGEKLSRWMAQVRHAIATGLRGNVSGDGGDLVLALALGQRNYLSASRLESLRRTGTSHLVAVSGLHVGMVAGAVFALLLFGLRRITGTLDPGGTFAGWIAGAGAGLAAAGYVAVASAPVSALRSLTMVALVGAARLTRRPLDPWTTVAVAAAVLALLDPAAPGTPSYDLSFSAVGSILLTVPLVRRRASRRFPELAARMAAGPLRVVKWVLLMGAATCAAALGTAPVAAAHFGSSAGAGVAVNVLAIPLLTFTVLPLALLAALVVLVSSPGSALCEGVCRLASACGELLLDSVGAAAMLPAPAPGAPLSPWVAIALGAVWVLSVTAWHAAGVRRRNLRLLAAAGAVASVAAAAAGWLWADRTPTGMLKATFVDVGQGDATLLEMPDGACILVDTGTGTHTDTVLRALAGRPLAGLVVTHGHPDHAGGAGAIRAAAKPERVLHNGSEASMSYAGHERGPPPPWTFGGARVEVLWPPWKVGVAAPPSAPATGLGENDASVVLRVTFGARVLLLAGDVERDAERGLLSSGAPLRADVVKVGHHGSLTSSTGAFVRATSARDAVFSCGWANRYGFPAAAVVATWLGAGAREWRTSRDGAVTVTTDGRTLTLTAAGRR